MPKLERVQLTVGNLGRSKYPFNSRENENIWAGECVSCMRSLYRDEVFRASWVAKKTSAPPEGELTGQYSTGKERWDVPKRPPFLRNVVWEFWVVDKDDLESHEALENGR